MSILQLYQGIIIGILLITGSLGLLMAVKKIERGMNINYAFASFFISGYLYFNLSSAYAVSVQEIIFYEKLSNGLIFLAVIPYLLLIANITNYKPKIALSILTVILFVFILFNIIQPYGIYYFTIDNIKSVELLWGEKIVSPTGINSTWVWIIIIYMLMLLAYLYKASIYHYRFNNKKEATILFLVYSIVIISFILHNILASTGDFTYSSVENVSFLAPTFIITYRNLYNLIMSSDIRAALVESEQRFRSVWINSVDGMRLTDREGFIIDVNEAYCQMVKLPREKLVGKVFSIIYQPEGPNDDLSLYKKRFDEGEILSRLYGVATLWNGEKIHLEISSSFIEIDGKEKMFLGIFRDVTERKRSDEMLTLLSHAVKSVGQGISITDLHNNLLFVNQSFLTMYGYTQEEIIGKHVSIVLAEETFDDKVVINNTLLGGWQGEILNRKKDGSIFPIFLSTAVVCDEKEAPVALIGVATDITERKRAEETLLENERKFRTVADFTYDWEYWMDPTGNLVYVSPSCERITGYKPEELQANPSLLSTIIHPDNRQEIIKQLQDGKVSKQIYQLEFRIIACDGKEHWIGHISQPVYSLDGSWIGQRVSNRDITARMHAEKLTQTLLNISEAVHFAVNLEELYADISGSLAEIISANNFFIALISNNGKDIYFPYEVDEKPTDNLFVIKVNDPQSLTAEVIQTKKSLLLNDKELKERYASGKSKVWGTAPKCWLGVPLFVGGKVIGVMAVQDYNREDAYNKEDLLLLESTAGQVAFAIERKRAEETLYQNQTMLTHILNSVPQSIFWKDQNSVYMGCNAVFAQEAGIESPELIIGKTDYDFPWLPEETEAYRADDREVIKSNHQKLHIIEPLHRADGTHLWLDTCKIPLTNEKGEVNGILGVYENITERKLAEEDRLVHLRFLENMNKINLAIQSTHDLEKMMTNVLEIMLSIFDCDRAWLLYPCDPDASSFRVPMEITKSEYPGAKILNVDIPMTPEQAQNMREALGSDSPVTYTVGTDKPISADKQFGVKSQMFIPVYPKLEKPWVFGMHQCSYPRIWLQEEKRLFQEISRRLSDSLTSLLVLGDLKESEEKYRSLVDNMNEGIFILDETSMITFANKALAIIYGYDSPDKLMNRNFMEFIEPSVRNEITQKFSNAIQSKENIFEIDLPLIKPDGSLAYILVKPNLALEGDRIVGIIGIVQDITERKRAEEALRESEARVRIKLDTLLAPEGDIGNLDLADIIDVPVIQAIMDQFYKLSNVGIGIIDLKGKILVATGWQDICTKYHRVHPETCKFCIESDIELTKDVVPGFFKVYWCKNNLWDIATPISVGGKHLGNIFLGQFFFEDDSIDYDLYRAQAHKYGFNEDEYISALERIPRWSKEKVNTAIKFYTAFAEIISNLSYSNIQLARSLTEREHLVDSLQESEAKYRLIAENTADTIAILDLNLTTTYVSPSVLKLRGYTAQEAMSHSLNQILTPESLHKANNTFAEQMELEASGKADPSRTVLLDLEEYHKDGSNIWVEIAVSFIRDIMLKPTGILTVTRDITERKQAEVELRRLTHAIEQSPVSVVITNAAGNIEYVNPKFTEITGYTKDEVHGKNPHILKSGETDPREYKQLWEAITAGKEWQGEFHNKKKNGELFWEAASISPVRNDKGTITHFVAIKEDITERKQAEKELKERITRSELIAHIGQRTTAILDLGELLLQTVNLIQVTFDYYNVIIFLKEENYIVLKATTLVFAQHMIGKAKLRIGEEGITGWVAESGKPLLVSDVTKDKRYYLEHEKTETKSEIAVPIKLKGEIIGVLDAQSIEYNAFTQIDVLTLQTIADQLAIAIVNARLYESAQSEISERKRAEEELKEYRLHLEDVIKERTKELEEVNSLLQEEIIKQKEADEKVRAALEKEKELSEMKSKFISVASHEFRTPLTTVLSSTELLERYGRNWDNEKYIKQTNRIKKSIQYLTYLMDDVLLISRADTGKITFNPKKIDLDKFCFNLLEDVKVLVTNDHVLEYVYDVSIKTLYMDEKLLKHILTNLLSNAIKYSVNGGKVGFFISSGFNEIEFKISDEGIGIPDEDQPNLFESFNRGKNVGDIHGTGLGMSIVKRSIDLHGGSISFKSKVGVGTTFIVKIPLRQLE